MKGLSRQIRRSQVGGWIGLFGVLVGWPSPTLATSPNILFVVIDTLRQDHVGCYGYPRETTPTLDRLAASGVRCEQLIAESSWTKPSMATLFTGVPSSVHRATTPQGVMNTNLPTLAVCLSDAGYQTAGITANPVTKRDYGFANGFDFYDDYTIALGAELDLFGDGEKESSVYHEVTGSEVSRLAMMWLQERRDPERPFFLHLLYFDPHDSYAPPPHYRDLFVDPDYDGAQDGGNILLLRGKDVPQHERQHLIDLYDGEIRYTDDQIGKLLAFLDRAGLREETIVIVLSDHGEEFWDHGSVQHGHTLYEELVRVPCIVSGPGIATNRVLAQQFSHLDVMPTVLEFAGISVPKSCEGTSVASVFRGESDRWPDRPAFMETGHGNTALYGFRTPICKIIHSRQGDTRYAYELVTDPREQTRVTEAVQRRLVDADATLREWSGRLHRAAGDVPGSQTTPVVDPKRLAELRALGYLQ